MALGALIDHASPAPDDCSNLAVTPPIAPLPLNLLLAALPPYLPR
jgi:hypothetical protein